MALRLFCLTSLVVLVTSYPQFQVQIPNGNAVPYPCRPGMVWPGVGHILPGGTGFRNPFGLDFAAAGYVWTKELCGKDSDDDGLTNGEELGDPDCMWKVGQEPNRSSSLSHPGICEPWDSPRCFKKSIDHPQYSNQEMWMREKCQALPFMCSPLQDAAVKSIDIPVAQGRVSIGKEMSSQCRLYNFQESGEFHIIGTEPLVDIEEVLHHMYLFGCDDDQEVTDDVFSCDLLPTPKCTKIIGSWSIGQAGQCFKDVEGIRLGNMGYKVLAVQTHWFSQNGLLNIEDKSGLRLYYTPNLRPNDADIFAIGSVNFTLPPNSESETIMGVCPNNCTRNILLGPIYVTSATHYMHLAGRKMSITIKRDDTLIPVTNGPIYSYYSPQVINFEQAIEVRPGDELITTCKFSTRDTMSPISSGTGPDVETCRGYLTFYPAQNVKTMSCIDEPNSPPMCRP